MAKEVAKREVIVLFEDEGTPINSVSLRHLVFIMAGLNFLAILGVDFVHFSEGSADWSWLIFMSVMGTAIPFGTLGFVMRLKFKLEVTADHLILSNSLVRTHNALTLILKVSVETRKVRGEEKRVIIFYFK